jgi:hypothetical protein
VIPLAWFAALLARHSSVHALIVFCWAKAGLDASAASNSAEQSVRIERI